MEDTNKQLENAFAIYGELINFLGNKSNELKFDMYARATAHVNTTPENVTEIIDNIKNGVETLEESIEQEIKDKL